jgi:hypothetical protein
MELVGDLAPRQASPSSLRAARGRTPGSRASSAVSGTSTSTVSSSSRPLRPNSWRIDYNNERPPLAYSRTEDMPVTVAFAASQERSCSVGHFAPYPKRPARSPRIGESRTDDRVDSPESSADRRHSLTHQECPPTQGPAEGASERLRPGHGAFGGAASSSDGLAGQHASRRVEDREVEDPGPAGGAHRLAP